MSSFETIIIGGGLLLRESPFDPQYQRFRIKGNHILNAMGILGAPEDLDFLSEYKYVSVRSHGDRTKIAEIKNVFVVPCTSMLLEDNPGFHFKFRRPSIGFHLFPEFLSDQDLSIFISWCKGKIKMGYELFLIPITIYRNDFEQFKTIANRIGEGCVLMPNLDPLDVFTFIGKLTYMISFSLHGAIFAYTHNVQFLLANLSEKTHYFLEDRGLVDYGFKTIAEMMTLFDQAPSMDFSGLIANDLNRLNEHIYTLKTIL
ncbi:MAG: polysaccharide pyruvyl transferase family protein [Saprospiraceae bacterium]